MELPLVCCAQCELRTCICFLNAWGIKTAEIHQQLAKVYDTECIAVQHVCKWCHLFSDGRKNTHDETRSGRPSEAVNIEAITSVPALIEDKHHKMIKNICTELIEKHQINISHGNIHNIVHNVLLFWKVCARWVPRSLSEEHQTEWGCAWAFDALLIKRRGLSAMHSHGGWVLDPFLHSGNEKIVNDMDSARPECPQKIWNTCVCG